MTLTLATQYEFRGTYALKVDPRGREIVLLGMQDMLVLITPAQREALQKKELMFSPEGELIHLVRTQHP